MSSVTRIVAGTLGAIAIAAGAAATATAAPAASASAASAPYTLLADGSHTEYQVNPVLTQDDVLNTNKDFTSLPGVRAHSIDGRNFTFYRLVDGARIGMVRINEVCLPTGVCHGLIVDGPSPVF
ncbi:hypothetical protein [Rhodococcus sp. UNC363MFTsu5.1]|uniref:hypothetical protein n=1 Tax=Rhodococcus sp. UNC363MFTsu5.1 TaxID=1449069 RepID=UPI00047FDE88|nr:hypothetical protein [Rhodococcus sp. UNC363MFTsu5.1]